MVSQQGHKWFPTWSNAMKIFKILASEHVGNGASLTDPYFQRRESSTIFARIQLFSFPITNSAHPEKAQWFAYFTKNLFPS